jgi:protein TonB
MTSNEILKADVLDIVFENRNKKYGAYLLRKYYNNRLAIGLAGMLGLVLVVMLIIFLNPGMRQAISNIANPGKDNLKYVIPDQKIM